MTWAPLDSVEIVKVDVDAAPTPLRALPGPRSVAPSKNSTDPVGVPPLPLVFVTVAVKVIAWPGRDGLLSEATPTLTAASTACVVMPLESVKSPVAV